jgi:apoptosis-stimulating of p53 protein 1
MFHRIIRFDQVRFLVDNGACVFATTLSDHETAADKCEQDEDGYESCSLYLLGMCTKLKKKNPTFLYQAHKSKWAVRR